MYVISTYLQCIGNGQSHNGTVEVREDAKQGCAKNEAVPQKLQPYPQPPTETTVT